MGIEQIIYYCLACFVVVIVPGPTVTLIIVNSISFGTRAGLLNVAGTQLGLILMIGLLAIGFQVVAQQLEWFLIAIRFLGAIYLVWLGYNIFTSPSLIVNYYRYGPKATDEKYPNNKYLSISENNAWDLIRKLHKVDPYFFIAVIRDICNLIKQVLI